MPGRKNVNVAAPGVKLTYDDFLLFPDDGKRHELIDGEHYVTPSPNESHQRISRNLHFAIRPWLGTQPVGRVYYAPFDVIFSDFDVVESDLLYMSHERGAEALIPMHVRGVPELVVEIASRSTKKRDETIKHGLSFDSPAGNEMDNYPTSSNPSILLNPDLNPQKSKNFEIGIKGNISNPEAQFFNNMSFEATFFNIFIEDEIIPFEVYGDVFFRNAAKTTRNGVEIGASEDIIEGLNLQASYTFSDFTYDEYIALNIDENLDTTSQNYAGNYAPSVPQHNAFFAAAYNDEIARGISAFVRGSVRDVT